MLLAIISLPLGIYLEDVYPTQNAEEISSLRVGDTVLPGTDVVDDSKIRRVPVINHHPYLLDYIEDQKYLNLVESLLTGTIQTPIVHLTSGSVSRQGIATGYDGPGMLIIKDGKLTVQRPGNFIWAFKTPYIYGYKTKDGLEIKENNQTLKVVGFDDISNETVPHDYVSTKSLKEWYEKASEGDKIVLDYSLSNFNDGRNMVPPSQIVTYFGESVKEYMINYPSGAPVMAYMHNYTTEEISSAVSYLGSYPEYGDTQRAYNAKQFAIRWNGTIIPPKTNASGKEKGGFISVADPEAPGGYAAHGTCPPARALRAVVTSAGCPLPRGMTWEFHTVLFGINPSTGVKVENKGDYPLLLVMWTTGAGANTQIYAKIYRLKPK